VIPIGDLHIHCGQVTCWCYPLEIQPGTWVHNAKDCREARERLTGMQCSPGWVSVAELVACCHFPTSAN
jgi:hypothetical protein